MTFVCHYTAKADENKTAKKPNPVEWVETLNVLQLDGLRGSVHWSSSHFQDFIWINNFCNINLSLNYIVRAHGTTVPNSGSPNVILLVGISKRLLGSGAQTQHLVTETFTLKQNWYKQQQKKKYTIGTVLPPYRYIIWGQMVFIFFLLSSQDCVQRQHKCRTISTLYITR